MSISTSGTPRLSDLQIHPPEVLTVSNADCPPVKRLEIAGGSVLVTPTEKLNPGQLRTLVLGAAGFKDIEIAQALHYSLDHIRHVRQSAFDNLQAINNPHAVTQAYRSGIFTTDAPIDSANLTDAEGSLLRFFAEGQTVATAAEGLDVQENTAAWQAYQLRRKYLLSRIPRVVLMGYLDGNLPLADEIVQPDTQLAKESMIVECTGSIKENADSNNSPESFTWGGGIVRLMKTELLDRKELLTLALGAIGMTNQDIAARTELTIDSVKAQTKRIRYKLGARDRSHAVSLAFKSGIFRIARYSDPIPFSEKQLEILMTYADGLTNQERLERIGTSQNTINTHMQRFRKLSGLAEPNTTATLTQAILSGAIPIKPQTPAKPRVPSAT